MIDRVMYKLEPILDNPKFEGFGLVNRASIRGKGSLGDDFMPDDIQEKGRAWTITHMAHLWRPLPVIGRVRPFNDYPCVSMSIPAFSRRAVDALRDILEANGELLPLQTDLGEYYAYNVTTVADVLDHERSEIKWYKDDKVIPLSIDYFAVRAERLEGLSIFRIVEDSVCTFVTNRFAKRAREHKLQGFNFRKVWPYPKGVNWRRPPKEEVAPEARAAELHDGMPIKGNSIVIRLQLAGKKPTKAEKKRIGVIEDELDELLIDPKADALYFGSLEGDDYVSGECRLFLSCPDADKLARRLKLWLRKLAWPGDKYLVKRFGEFVDARAHEEYVDLS